MFCDIDIIFDAEIWMEFIKMFKKGSISPSMLSTEYGFYETTSRVLKTIRYKALIDSIEYF